MNISIRHILVLLVIPAMATAQSGSEVRYNADELVMISVKGQISHPTIRTDVYRVTADGVPQVYPGSGGITYNFRVGDSAVHLASNHVEPAVSLHNPGPANDLNSTVSRALNALSNIGNEARVVTGDARGSAGVVIGKHGGAEHIMVDFADDGVYDKLVIGDEFQIRGYGTGMSLTNVDGVTVMNASPTLIDALNNSGMSATNDRKLRIGVVHIIPSKIMGSGLGRDQTYTGDYDINFFDRATIEEYGLDALRFGDIVAIKDADSTFGRVYRQGAITVGSVSHGRSESAGHGPGVTTLFTSREGRIEIFRDSAANLATLLNIREVK
jgi:hypothetical protein